MCVDSRSGSKALPIFFIYRESEVGFLIIFFLSVLGQEMGAYYARKHIKQKFSQALL